VKLSEARRAYLRELTEHRDKQRQLSVKAQRALASLQDSPVMFYEPLNTVLEEPTKDFIRQVVEERLKVEGQGLMREEKPLEPTDADGDYDEELAKEAHRDAVEAEKELALVKQEMKQLRMTSAREADARKRSQETEQRAQQEAAEALKLAEDRWQELSAFRKQVQAEKERRDEMGFEARAEADKVAAVAEATKELAEQVARQNEDLSDLQQQLEEASLREVSLQGDLAAAMEQVKELEDRLANQGGAAPSPAISNDSASKAEIAKLREEVQRHVETETLLREQNEALEEDLREREERLRTLSDDLDDLEAEAARQKFQSSMNGRADGERRAQERTAQEKAADRAARRASREAKAKEKAARAKEQPRAQAQTSAQAESQVQASDSETDQAQAPEGHQFDVQSAVKAATEHYEAQLRAQEAEIDRLRAQVQKLSSGGGVSGNGADAALEGRAKRRTQSWEETPTESNWEPEGEEDEDEDEDEVEARQRADSVKAIQFKKTSTEIAAFANAAEAVRLAGPNIDIQEAVRIATEAATAVATAEYGTLMEEQAAEIQRLSGQLERMKRGSSSENKYIRLEQKYERLQNEYDELKRDMESHQGAGSSPARGSRLSKRVPGDSPSRRGTDVSSTGSPLSKRSRKKQSLRVSIDDIGDTSSTQAPEGAPERGDNHSESEGSCDSGSSTGQPASIRIDMSAFSQGDAVHRSCPSCRQSLVILRQDSGLRSSLQRKTGSVSFDSADYTDDDDDFSGGSLRSAKVRDAAERFAAMARIPAASAGMSKASTLLSALSVLSEDAEVNAHIEQALNSGELAQAAERLEEAAGRVSTQGSPSSESQRLADGLSKAKVQIEGLVALASSNEDVSDALLESLSHRSRRSTASSAQLRRSRSSSSVLVVDHAADSGLKLTVAVLAAASSSLKQAARRIADLEVLCDEAELRDTITGSLYVLASTSLVGLKHKAQELYALPESSPGFEGLQQVAEQFEALGTLSEDVFLDNIIRTALAKGVASTNSPVSGLFQAAEELAGMAHMGNIASGMKQGGEPSQRLQEAMSGEGAEAAQGLIGAVDFGGAKSRLGSLAGSMPAVQRQSLGQAMEGVFLQQAGLAGMSAAALGSLSPGEDAGTGHQRSPAGGLEIVGHEVGHEVGRPLAEQLKAMAAASLVSPGSARAAQHLVGLATLAEDPQLCQLLTRVLSGDLMSMTQAGFKQAAEHLAASAGGNAGAKEAVQHLTALGSIAQDPALTRSLAQVLSPDPGMASSGSPAAREAMENAQALRALLGSAPSSLANLRALCGDAQLIHLAAAGSQQGGASFLLGQAGLSPAEAARLSQRANGRYSSLPVPGLNALAQASLLTDVNVRGHRMLDEMSNSRHGSDANQAFVSATYRNGMWKLRDGGSAKNHINIGPTISPAPTWSPDHNRSPSADGSPSPGSPSARSAGAMLCDSAGRCMGTFHAPVPVSSSAEPELRPPPPQFPPRFAPLLGGHRGSARSSEAPPPGRIPVASPLPLETKGSSAAASVPATAPASVAVSSSGTASAKASATASASATTSRARSSSPRMGTIPLACPSLDLAEVRVVARACSPASKPTPGSAAPAAPAERSRPQQRESGPTTRKSAPVLAMSASTPTISLEEHILPNLHVAGRELSSMTLPARTMGAGEAAAPVPASRWAPAVPLVAANKGTLALGTPSSVEERRKQPTLKAERLYERHQSSPSLPLCVKGSSPPAHPPAVLTAANAP